MTNTKIKTMRHEESKIQQACVRWFSYQYPEYRHVFGSSSNGVCTSVIQARILKAEGLLAGEADIHLYVARQGFHGLFVEMKTATGRQSENQQTFEKSVTKQGYKYCVCRSFEEFMKMINEYLNEKI